MTITLDGFFWFSLSCFLFAMGGLCVVIMMMFFWAWWNDVL